MEQVSWTMQLETGIPEIDTQHKRIVHLVNTMREAKEKKDMDTVADVITEMVDYTHSHFSFEEALMENAGYPFLRAHRRVHELLTQRMPELQERFVAGEDITEELHKVLTRWLNHIKGEDQCYAKCIKAYLASKKRSAVSSPKPVAVHAASAMVNVRPGFWERLKFVFMPE